MNDFANKIIYITGAASGIGLEAGKQLAALGAHIVILDFNPTDASLQAIEAARRSPTQRVARYQMDIANRTAVIDTVNVAAAAIGAPDFVINSAGIGLADEFVNMKFETFDRVMQVNLNGSRHICEAVVPLMRERGKGQILLIASMAGVVSIYGYSAYATSKFAVRGFAEALRYELKPLGITVLCLCPGEVDTPLVATERLTIHPATLALKKVGGTISVDVAVRDLIKGMRRDQALIVTGFMARVTFWLHRLLPPSWWYAFADSIVARALRGMK
jgi:NAD(P)-dependent dehydrogenase (short-subunit alcohol dehydrogenase family)